MSQPTVLIVDDEPTQRKLIQHVLESKINFQAVTVEGGREAIDYVISRRLPLPEVILLDLSMPEVDGMQVIEKLHPLFPNLPIIVLTMYGDIEKAVTAIKAGATDFLSKPVAHERLRTSLLNALRINELANEVQRLRRTQTGQIVFDDIIGHSKALNGAKALAKRAAESRIPILIEGESGVGKELFARAIHGCSEFNSGPFVAVDCAAIPEGLVETTLFGQEKGAFTGAGYSSPGRFREAEGGTLFLDEVTELPPAAQARLLHVLQRREVEPVGAGQAVRINVRVISASNAGLQRAVKTGGFREDLYYRLNACPLPIPSLRERRDDLRPLAEYFLRRFAALENHRLRGITEEAMNLIERYDWPGNIRQLENLIFRAVVLADGEMIEYVTLRPLMPSSLYQENGGNGRERHSLLHSRQLSLLNEKGDLRRFRDLEEDALYFALKHYNGRISEVARKLGIGRSTLYRKISDFGIELEGKVA